MANEEEKKTAYYSVLTDISRAISKLVKDFKNATALHWRGTVQPFFWYRSAAGKHYLNAVVHDFNNGLSFSSLPYFFTRLPTQTNFELSDFSKKLAKNLEAKAQVMAERNNLLESKINDEVINALKNLRNSICREVGIEIAIDDSNSENYLAVLQAHIDEQLLTDSQQKTYQSQLDAISSKYYEYEIEREANELALRNIEHYKYLNPQNAEDTVGPVGLNNKFPALVFGNIVSGLIWYAPALLLKTFVIHWNLTPLILLFTSAISLSVLPFVAGAGLTLTIFGAKNIASAFVYGAFGNFFKRENEPENFNELKSKRGLVGNIFLWGLAGAAIGTILAGPFGAAIGAAIGAGGGGIVATIGIANILRAIRALFYGIGHGILAAVWGFYPQAKYAEAKKVIQKNSWLARLTTLWIFGLPSFIVGATARSILDGIYGFCYGVKYGLKFGFKPKTDYAIFVSKLKDLAIYKHRYFGVVMMPLTAVVTFPLGLITRGINDFVHGLWSGFECGWRIGVSWFREDEFKYTKEKFINNLNQDSHLQEGNYAAFLGGALSIIPTVPALFIVRGVRDLIIGAFHGLFSGIFEGFKPSRFLKRLRKENPETEFTGQQNPKLTAQMYTLKGAFLYHKKNRNYTAAYFSLVLGGAAGVGLGILLRAGKDFFKGIGTGIKYGFRAAFAPLRVERTQFLALKEFFEVHKEFSNNKAFWLRLKVHFKKENRELMACFTMPIAGLLILPFGILARFTRDLVKGFIHGIKHGALLGWNWFDEEARDGIHSTFFEESHFKSSPFHDEDEQETQNLARKRSDSHRAKHNYFAFVGGVISGIPSLIIGFLARGLRDLLYGFCRGLICGIFEGFSPLNIFYRLGEKNYSIVDRIIQDESKSTEEGKARNERIKEFFLYCSFKKAIGDYKQDRHFTGLYFSMPISSIMGLVVGFLIRGVFDFTRGIYIGFKKGAQSGYRPLTRKADVWIEAIYQEAKDKNIMALPGVMIFGGIAFLLAALVRANKDFIEGLKNGVKYGAKLGFSWFHFPERREVKDLFSKTLKSGNYFSCLGFIITSIPTILVSILVRGVRDLFYGLYRGFACGIFEGFSPLELIARWQRRAELSIFYDIRQGTLFHKKLISFAANPLTFPQIGERDEMGKRYISFRHALEGHFEKREYFAFPSFFVSGFVGFTTGLLLRSIRDLFSGIFDGLKFGATMGYAPMALNLNESNKFKTNDSESYFTNTEIFFRVLKKHARDSQNLMACISMPLTGFFIIPLSGFARIFKDFIVGLGQGIFHGGYLGLTWFSEKAKAKFFKVFWSKDENETQSHRKKGNYFSFIGATISGLPVLTMTLILTGVFDLLNGLIKGFVSGAFEGFCPVGVFKRLYDKEKHPLIVEAEKEGNKKSNLNDVLFKNLFKQYKENRIYLAAFVGLPIAGTFGFIAGAVARGIHDALMGIIDGFINGFISGTKPLSTLENDRPLYDTLCEHYRKQNVFAVVTETIVGSFTFILGMLVRAIVDTIKGILQGCLYGVMLGSSWFSKQEREYSKNLFGFGNFKEPGYWQNGNYLSMIGAIITGIPSVLFGLALRTCADFIVGSGLGLYYGFWLGIAPKGYKNEFQKSFKITVIDTAAEGGVIQEKFRSIPTLISMSLITPIGFITGLTGRTLMEITIGFGQGIFDSVVNGFHWFRSKEERKYFKKSLDKYYNAHWFIGIAIYGIIGILGSSVGIIAGIFNINNWKAAWHNVFKAAAYFAVYGLVLLIKNIIFKPTYGLFYKLPQLIVDMMNDKIKNNFSSIKFFRNLVHALPIPLLGKIISQFIPSSRYLNNLSQHPIALQPLIRALEIGDNEKGKLQLIEGAHKVLCNALIRVKHGISEIDLWGKLQDSNRSNRTYGVLRQLGSKSDSELILKSMHEKLLNGDIQFKQEVNQQDKPSDIPLMTVVKELNGKVAQVREKISAFRHRLFGHTQLSEMKKYTSDIIIEGEGHRLIYEKRTNKLLIEFDNNPKWPDKIDFHPKPKEVVVKNQEASKGNDPEFGFYSVQPNT